MKANAGVITHRLSLTNSVDIKLDVAGAYPNNGAVFNVSRETTAKEIVKIEGIDEYTQRMAGINLSAGHVNAVEICCNLFGMPTLTEMLDAFNEEIKEVDNLDKFSY